MREILFRGKSIANGEWIVGNYAAPLPSNWGATIEDAMNLPNLIHTVNPDTVGQYTGTKDKHSRRIFEGDIVKIPDNYDIYGINAGEVYEVYFGFGGFRLKPKYRKNAKGFYLEDDGVVEVIGNIYDNPELLEVEG